MKLSLPGGRSLELSKQPAPAKADGKEQGSSAGMYAQGYFDLENYLGKIRNPSISQIMNMIDNDGTAQALYNFITAPVLASEWHIAPDPADVLVTKNPDGTESTTHPQTDFVEAALRNPEHKGGMSTPFSLVIADICLAVAQGYRFFEIVYKLDDEGRIVFQKVVAREAGDIKILLDTTGGFAGVSQNVKDAQGSTQTVTIEIPYCFLFTYKKERNKIRGASALRAAWYHYDKKHRLYYLQNQQAQAAALGIKVLESPDGSQKGDRDENLVAVDKMAVRPSIALPFGWKLTVTQPPKGMDMQPAIDGHDVQMARSVLAQGMLQGNSSATNGGSYSLGEVHFDSFMLGEMALMGAIEEHVTSYLISKLYDYNFDNPLYGDFKFNALTDDVTELLREAFKGLTTKGAIPKWVAEAISDRVAEQMGIEKPENADELLIGGTTPKGDGSDGSGDGSGDGEGDDPNGDGTGDGEGDGKTGKRHQSKKKGRFAKGDWWRELTAAEAKVQFAAIQKDADKAEATLNDDIKPLWTTLTNDTVKRLKPILNGDNPAKAMDSFTLGSYADIQKTMLGVMTDTYSQAKTQAADEIKKAAPANKAASKTLMTQHVQSIADKQTGDLLFNLKTIVTNAIRKNLLDKSELSIGDILTQVQGMFDDFLDDKMDLTVSSLVSLALNIGRDDVFQTYDNDVYGYQYSAILDSSVCPICEDLDSSVATEAEYYSTVWMPPIHFNCRCIWVAIMNDEDDKPDFTGIPDSPGGADGPTLSYTHDGKEYDIFLSKQAANLWQSRQSNRQE